MERKKIMQGLLSAIQFLTIIPCPTRHEFNARAALPFFPVCGLIIGIALIVIDTAASIIWPRPVVAMVDILALVVISGALHLDGLADTADGLYGHRETERALEIMKDSRVGAMGLVAVLCCLAMKWVAISNITGHYKIWLLLIPAYSRASVLFGIKFLPYGRPGEGTGKTFFDPPLQRKDFWGVGLLMILSLLTCGGFILVNVCFAIVVFTILGWYSKKINGITGDMLGALIEVTEVALFMVAAS